MFDSILINFFKDSKNFTITLLKNYYQKNLTIIKKLYSYIHWVVHAVNHWIFWKDFSDFDQLWQIWFCSCLPHLVLYFFFAT